MLVRRYLLIMIMAMSSASYAGPKGGGSIPAPNFNIKSINLGQLSNLQETYFEKKLVHKPEYLVNTYLGTFKTSFVIDLPKNAFFQDGLWFDYNSSQSLNLGYGIGFDLRLPKIRSRNGKFFYTMSSPNELVEVKNSTIDIGLRLARLSNILNKTLLPIARYRLLDEDDFSLFLKLNDGFLQLKPGGESLIYSNEGQLITLVSANSLILHLSYNDHRLTRLISPSEGWNAAIDYKEQEAQFKFIEGKFIQVPRGINGIAVTQGATQRQYFFTYKSDLLISVKKEGALHDLFIAEYQVQKGSATQTAFQGQNIAEKAIVFKNYEKRAEFEAPANNGDKQIIQLDLNGDFITDEVTIEFSANSASSKQKFKEFFAKVGSVMCDERCYYEIDDQLFNQAKRNYEAYLNSQKFNVSVKFGKFVNTTYQLESDSSLNLALNISDLGYFSFAEDKKQGLSLSFTQKRTPRFMDLNSDGRKDLVLCSSSAEKDFVEKNSKQDLLVQSVFNLINKPTNDNIFNYNGETPIVYLFKTDEAKLTNLEVDNKNDIYHIANVSTWKNISPEFKCHSQSMQFDYNQDGISDILTGKTVYIMGDNGEARAQQLSEIELKSLFNISGLSEESMAKVRYGLIDSSGNGVLDTFVANNYYIQPTDRKLHILSNDTDLLLERPSDVPYLTSLRSSFGGKVKITYSYVDGAYVVKNVLHDVSDIDQNNWDESFNYEGSRWHVQKNIFLGFKKGIVEKKIWSNKTNEILRSSEKRISEYDLDDQNGPVFYLSRARKAGRVINEKVIDHQDLKREVVNKYIDHAFSDKRIFSYIASHEVKEIGKSDLKIITDYPQYLNDIPVKMREQKITGASSEIDFSEQSLLDSTYLIRPVSHYRLNRFNEKRLIEINHWDNFGRLELRQTPSFEEKYLYDNLGRVTKYETTNGKVQTYTYVALLPLVKSTNINNVTTNYSYDDVDNNVTGMQIEGSPEFQFNYWTDGVLKKITRGSQVLFESNLINKRLFETKQLDELFKIKLDGFGRVSSSSKVGQDDNLILSKNSFDDEDRVVAFSSPFFENTPSTNAYTQRVFDGLGNIVNEKNFDEQHNLLSEFSTSFNLCANKVSDVGFTEKVCKDGQGDMVSSSIPNETSFFEYGFSGEIKSVKPLGHSYNRNAQGDIVTSSSDLWGKFSRVYNYQKNMVSYDDGVVELKNAYGDFLAYSNGLNTPSQVKIEAEYKLQLMNSLSVNLGNHFFNQSYTYNSSRALINKKEFNTSWKYELDQYDRVREETVTDVKNIYKLKYGRTNSVITSIAPYVSNIVYSPRMKPVLVEYANGSSAEYVYGPRGELLSYSLVKKNEVFYSSKNTYRSDLKLASTSVVTGDVFEEQIQNYSYNNRFEFDSNDGVKNQMARDSKGQVSRLMNLEMEYHHLNLVQVKSDKGILTNYYGGDNQFIGSCNQANSCFYKVSANEVELSGEIQKLIVVDNVPVGILFQGQFFPVIIDQQMAVIGILNPDGDSVLFLRKLDVWGNVKSITGDLRFEKSIAFGYAHLIQNPLLEKLSSSKLYFSNTRVYSPAAGEWLSPDSTVIWSPEKLVSMPGNWNPFKYANNDPVNFIDPSGRFANLVAGAIFGGIAGAISASAMNKDVMEGAAIGAMTGVAYASGVGIVAQVTSFVAQSSVIGIFTFTGNVLGQAIFSKSVNMVEAASVTILAPFSFAYGNLFKAVPSEYVREFASGISFMSVDLAASFGSSSIGSSAQSNLEKGTSRTNQLNQYQMGNYNLKTSYGN